MLGTHFRSDKAPRSVLPDSKAGLLIYGNTERAIGEQTQLSELYHNLTLSHQDSNHRLRLLTRSLTLPPAGATHALHYTSAHVTPSNCSF
jgi:hypothetical protein